MNENSPFKKWTILLIVITSTFMCTLDSSIINVALPQMAVSLNVTTSQIQLVATSYLIAISAIILIFGRLGDLFGKTRVFKLGLIVFTIGSLLCSFSISFAMLLLARVVQAVGAAGLMANNQGIITEVFPANERGKALGFLGTSVALGSLVGPGLGGLIVGSLSWQYIFVINIPIGVIVFFLAMYFLPKKSDIHKEPMDYPGSILFLVVIVSLFVSLDTGMTDSFLNPLVLAGFLVAVIAFVVFLYWEKKSLHPLLQLDIFKNKLFSLSIFCGFISYVALFCHNIILPFYLQDAMSFNPTKSGLILMIYPLFLMFVAPCSGYLSDKIGSELLTFIGLLLTSVGLFLMSMLTQTTSIATMFIFIAMMSIGMGLFQAPNNSLIMSTVPKNKLGIAGSINALVRNIGMICGIDLATTMLYSFMSSKVGYHVTDYIQGRDDAFIYGMHAVYLTASVICLFGALLTFLRIRKKMQPGD